MGTVTPDATVQKLLDYAKRQPKGDYQTYAQFMRCLSALMISPSQHQDAQRELIDILEV